MKNIILVIMVCLICSGCSTYKQPEWEAKLWENVHAQKPVSNEDYHILIHAWGEQAGIAGECYEYLNNGDPETEQIRLQLERVGYEQRALLDLLLENREGLHCTWIKKESEAGK